MKTITAKVRFGPSYYISKGNDQVAKGKTILLLPDWFFKRQLGVSITVCLVIPAVLLLTDSHGREHPIINWIACILILIAMTMLYPYSRYAVQKIIDYWYGNERVYHDASMHATLGRKYEKMVAGFFLLPVLGPACLVLLLLARWKHKEK